MKLKGKTFFLMVACISIGFYMSNFMFRQYDTKAISSYDTIYLLQIGSYSSQKEMDMALMNVDTYLMEKENDKYFAYIALTASLSNYEKLKNYYVKRGFKIEQRQKILENNTFKKTLDKYDLLLEKSTEDTTIEKLELELIQKYKEVNNG